MIMSPGRFGMTLFIFSSRNVNQLGMYKRELLIEANSSSFSYFFKPKLIFIENILKNKKTGTCFHDNGTIHVTIDLEYPNKFETTMYD